MVRIGFWGQVLERPLEKRNPILVIKALTLVGRVHEHKDFALNRYPKVQTEQVGFEWSLGFKSLGV